MASPWMEQQRTMAEAVASRGSELGGSFAWTTILHAGNGASGDGGGLGGRGGEGGGDGDGGGGDDGGGNGARSGGYGGDDGPQLTTTRSTAASPVKLVPRVYTKANDPEPTSTLALFHSLPWSPLMLHSVPPAPSVRLSVPMVAPYMW